MNVYKVILLVMVGLSALLTVSQVGKKKEPTTPTVAVVALVLNGVYAWLVVQA